MRRFQKSPPRLLLLVLLLAVSSFAQPAADPPKSEADRLMKEATKALQEKRFDDAIAGTTKVLALYPESGDVYFSRGLAYLQKGEKELALADFSKTLTLKTRPEIRTPARRVRGSLLYQLKRYDEAIRDFDLVIGEGTDDFRDYAFRAWSHHSLKNYEPALADFDAAIKLAPREIGLRRFRAAIFNRFGRHQQAVDDIDEELRLNPQSHPEVFRIRAEAYRRLGRAELAGADEKKYAELTRKPEAAGPAAPQIEALLRTSQQQFRSQQWDAAIKTYEEVLALLGPEHENAYAVFFSRGRAFFQKREFDAALKDYNEVIRRKPNLAMPYTFRGEIYLGRRQFDLARRDFDRAIELAPAEILSYRRRAELFYLTKDYDGAIRDASEVVRIDAGYLSGWYYRGAAYLEKGSFQQAADDFTAYLKLDPNDADVYQERAKAFRGLGKIKEAQADEEKARVLAAIPK